VMDRQSGDEPTPVPATAKPVGEVRAHWAWTEPSVWTERMLTALESGVRGGKWHSLIDKVWSLANLRAAYARVKRNHGAAGVDHQTVEGFERRREENLARISEQLREGKYQPQAVRRVWIPKPGRKEKRPLGVPTVRDRVTQTALRNVLEPIFEHEFAQHSYGFRPGRGAKDALRRVDALLKQGFTWVVDADIKSFFDSIDHERMMALMEQKIADSRVLALLGQYLGQRVMASMEAWTPESGTPQGAVISPLLANIFLNPLDHEMAQAGYEMTRYADDFVVQCRSEEEARAALAVIQTWMTAAGLRLHPDKTRIVSATAQGGFDFLGYHFEAGKRWPSKKSKQKLKDRHRALTPRTSGDSLKAIIASTNRVTRGWFEYFKHSHHTIFPELDGWLRGRLRSILRKRRGGKGRARGHDHQRWPNSFFAKQGLFSMTAAYGLASQSSRR